MTFILKKCTKDCKNLAKKACSSERALNIKKIIGKNYLQLEKSLPFSLRFSYLPYHHRGGFEGILTTIHPAVRLSTVDQTRTVNINRTIDENYLP